MNTTTQPRRSETDQWRTGAFFAALFASATLLAWARLPWSIRNILWAEDGRVFLQQRSQFGPFATLLNPYAGYLHLWPRALTDLVVQLNGLDTYAAAMTFASCAFVGAVTVLVFVCSRSITGWMPARLALAATTLLVPTAPIEVLGDAANLHWYCLWAALWLMIFTPRSWTSSIVLAVIGLTLALTEIQIVILAPLVIYRFRSAKMWPIRAGLCLGIIGQAIATLSSPRSVGSQLPPFWSFVQGYFVEVVTPSWLGQDSTAGWVIAHTGWWIGIALFVPFAASFIYVMVRGTSPMRALSVALLGTSIAVWVLAYRQTGLQFDFAAYSPADYDALYLTRYSVVTSLCLLPLPILAATVLKQSASRRQHSAATAVIVVTMLVLVGNFGPAATRRAGAPDWQDGLNAARTECTHDPSTISQIPTAPTNADWYVELTCDFIDHK